MKKTAKQLVGDGDTFELDGLTFRVEHEHDSTMGTPWEEHDGHGIVSAWVTREKLPGERVLASDEPWHRYYDIQATLEIAKRDGWGVEHAEGKTKRQIIAEAVDEDFNRMKAWCDDKWKWIGVCVELLDTDGDPVRKPDARDSLWGIESDSGDDYLDEVARGCAADIAARFEGKTEVCVKIRKEVK